MDKSRAEGETRLQSGPRFPSAELNAASMAYHLKQCGWIPEKEEKESDSTQRGSKDKESETRRR
eukprot:CAMPEP_0178440320 /NCGR_PEP_ID=MMETSP0689_2-20121128/36704_1 /TAXON_ID=160604 /ORGANISM="Amphidinium massartii, Strain CS-259" /LENGTH=63 /DNA_ID=CAMNT_0020063063 /DNA_START=9 /DNA_END=200 /DNA_ORIENTATION=-